jgi:hypothetical protein
MPVDLDKVLAQVENVAAKLQKSDCTPDQTLQTAIALTLLDIALTVRAINERPL